MFFIYIYFCKEIFNSFLNEVIDCQIDTNNNNPAGLEHCKLMANVVQYLINEGKLLNKFSLVTPHW